MDTHVFVGLPDPRTRTEVLYQEFQAVREGVDITDEEFESLIYRMDGWSNKDICTMVRKAIRARKSRMRAPSVLSPLSSPLSPLSALLSLSPLSLLKEAKEEDEEEEEGPAPEPEFRRMLSLEDLGVPRPKPPGEYGPNNEAFALKDGSDKPAPSTFSGIDATPLKERRPIPDAFRMVGVSRKKGDSVEVLRKNGEWVKAQIVAVSISRRSRRSESSESLESLESSESSNVYNVKYKGRGAAASEKLVPPDRVRM